MSYKSDEEIIIVGCGVCDLVNGKYQCHDVKDHINCFWATNVTDNKNMFDFDHAFGDMRYPVENKLTEHGILDPEAYLDFMNEISPDINDVRNWAITSSQGYTTIDETELQDVLAEYVSKRMRETYEDVDEFKKIKEVNDKLDDVENLSLKEKTLLFDKMIHLQHVTGSVYDVDIEDLRNDF